MCVIIVKPAGVPLIEAIIQQCWACNPDGAGIAYVVGSVVHVEKGFMKLHEYLDFLHDIDREYGAVLHMRIATSGGINPAMTHPFGISATRAELTSVSYNSSMAVAHNGIIPITPEEGLSDTATYVKNALYPRFRRDANFVASPRVQREIENEIASKMALINKDYIYMIGSFKEHDHLFFSNMRWAN